jgi:hypothetical protein
MRNQSRSFRAAFLLGNPLGAPSQPALLLWINISRIWNWRLIAMRFYEFSRPRQTARQKWLSTITLFVLQDEWERLQAILKDHGSTEITAVRPLCRFSGLSVDVECESPDAAWALLGKWHDHSVQKLCQTAAQEETRKDRDRSN